MVAKKKGKNQDESLLIWRILLTMLFVSFYHKVWTWFRWGKNIFSQSNHSCKLYFILGGYFSAKKLALRSVAAVWCLSCFILVQSYSSVLISVMTLPKLKPIINSVYDIPKISGLQVVANRGMAVQAALSVRKPSIVIIC